MNTKYYLTCASILSAGLLAGCGEATTGTPTAATLKVDFSTPLNKSTGAAIDKPITITFADALDRNSVLSSNIMLMPGSSGGMAGMDMDSMGDMDHSTTDMTDMSVIPGDVKCDPLSFDCKTIIFTPTMSLAWGQQYHIMVHGLRTASGKTFSGEHVVPLEFTTAYVVETKSQRNIHDPSRTSTTITEYLPGFNTAPVRKMRTQTSINNGVQQTQVTLYNQQVGQRQADVRLKNNINVSIINDPLNQIDRYTYRLMEGGKMVATVIFSDPGTDQQWGTNDDLVSSYTVRGADHGTHRLTASFGVPRGAQGVEVNPLSLNGLKAKAEFVSQRATLMFFETTPNSAQAPRMKKSIRFSTLGANKTADIDNFGNKTPTSDDVIEEYQVYEYDGLHGSRSARKEYEGNNLTLNQSTDPLTGFRVYKTSKDPNLFGNAVGMLRVAEITYSGNSFSSTINNQDILPVRDFELNFYCPTTYDSVTARPSGLYEKFEIEVGMNGQQIPSGNTAFPNAAIEQALVNTQNCTMEPTQLNLQTVLQQLGGTLQDISENTRFQ